MSIELLVRAVELLEAYQVGSIPTEKLDSNTNKLIVDFEKEYPIPESVNKRQNPLKDFREKRRLRKENRKKFFN